MSNHTLTYRWCSDYADEVILPSQAMLSYLNTDATVVPFGIDTDVFSPMPKERAREEVGWEKNENIVLFPYSRCWSVMNFSLAKQVTEQIHSAELCNITGKSHEEVATYMNTANAVLVSSKRESGAMVVKDAALCNVPIVSTDVGFASEVLSDVKNSYVCSSENKLRDQLEAVLKSKEGSDGQKHADNWGLDRMGERPVDVYESVLKK